MAIRNYRMNSIMGQNRPKIGFGPQPSPTFRTPFQQPSDQIGELNAPPQRSEASRFYDEMQRIRNQATPGLSAYQGALKEMPTPEQYKPNWLTRIAAGLGGLSSGMKDAGAGIQTAMSLNRAPYEMAMETYTNRLGGLKEQAEMEQRDRTSRLKAIQDANELGLKYKEYEMKRDESANLQETRTTTAKAATTRADATMMQAQAAARDDYDYVPVQGGFMARNKNDPQDTKMVPARTIQDAQLAVSQMNAGSQRISAGASASQAASAAARVPIAQQEADTERASQVQTGKNIESQITTRGQRTQTPASQKTARKLQ